MAFQENDFTLPKLFDEASNTFSDIESSSCSSQQQYQQSLGMISQISISSENTCSVFNSITTSYTLTNNNRSSLIDIFLQEYQQMVNDQCINLFKEQQKSNFLKNLIRSFNRFVLKDGDSIVIECLDIYQKNQFQIRQQYQKFIKRRKLNNSLIRDLIQNERFGAIFKYYLQNYAADWLKLSLKITDIRYHAFYIVFLQRSFNEPALFETIKFYSK